MHEIDRDTHDRRIKGAVLTNNMFLTYLPISTVDDAVQRMKVNTHAAKSE